MKNKNNKYPKNQKEFNKLILETYERLEEVREQPLVFVDINGSQIDFNKEREKYDICRRSKNN